MFGKLQKIWAVIEVLKVLLVGPADLDIFCSCSFSHHITFYSFVFMQKIFTRLDCVNGKHRRSTLHFLTQFQCKSYSEILTYDSVNPLVVLIFITLPYLFQALILTLFLAYHGFT